MTSEELWRQWLETRPECVKKLAEEFPLGTELSYEGELLYLVGYTEGDQLIFSPVSPWEDYNKALKRKVYVCAEHLRDDCDFPPRKT